MDDGASQAKVSELTPEPLAATFLQDVRAFGQYLRDYRVEFGVMALATSVILIEPYARRSLLANGIEPWVTAFFLFGVVPLVAARLLGLPMRELGLGLGEVRRWLPLTLATLAISLPLLIIGTEMSEIDRFYSTRSFDPVRSLVTVTIYMIGWEFLTRGFLLFGLRKRLGELSILVQIIPFTLAHMEKPLAEALSCVLSGLVWGYICYRGRSFWPAVLLHVVVNYAGQALVSLR